MKDTLERRTHSRMIHGVTAVPESVAVQGFGRVRYRKPRMVTTEVVAYLVRVGIVVKAVRTHDREAATLVCVVIIFPATQKKEVRNMLVMRFRLPVGTLPWGRGDLVLWTFLGAGSEACLAEPKTKKLRERNDDGRTGFRDCLYLASLLRAVRRCVAVLAGSAVTSKSC